MSDVQESSFKVDGGRAAVSGALNFATVGGLLKRGVESINSKQVSSIDLAGVAGADSAGLALLIEWLSVAKACGQSLRYENLSAQLLQLAKLCDVESLLTGDAKGG